MIEEQNICKYRGSADLITDGDLPEREERPIDWPAYNEAQTSEALLFQELLHSILLNVVPDEPSSRGKGRPKIGLRDVLFCCAFKVYLGKSSRRTMSFLEYAKKQGYIQKVPHFNSILNYFGRPEMNTALYGILDESCKPLRCVETDFAVDATGFGTMYYRRWFDDEYKKHKVRKEFVKAHAICGVKTNIVTGIIVTDGHKHETKCFGDLIDSTAKNFLIKEVLADPAYLADKNLEKVEEYGGTPYILFTSRNSATPTDIYRRSAIWMRMVLLFHEHREEYLKHYHMRSNVESLFSMIKRKFSPTLLSKKEEARVNELLMMFLCHNLVVLIHEMIESGIDVK
jgi:transposase